MVGMVADGLVAHLVPHDPAHGLVVWYLVLALVAVYTSQLKIGFAGPGFAGPGKATRICFWGGTTVGVLAHELQTQFTF